MNYTRTANFYLGERYIKSPVFSNQELKDLIGVDLAELRHLWVFSSRNHFKEAVESLIHNDVKIDFNEANKFKSSKMRPLKIKNETNATSKKKKFKSN